MSTKSPISLLPLGANLHAFTAPGSDLPLVLSLPTQQSYTKTGNPAYLGETIGRVANRIRDGKLNVNGKTYQLEKNNGPNNLHGGPKGWGKQLWSGPFNEDAGSGKSRTRFEYVSEDGDQGYPGRVEAKAWYTGYEEGGKSVVEVEYEVLFPKEPKGDEGVTETAVSVTNHTAFSVGPALSADQGGRSLEGTKFILETDKYQVLNENQIPTGEIGTYPNVTVGKEILLGKDQPKFDDCMVMDTEPSGVPLDTRKRELKKLLTAKNDDSGITFEAWSTEPAFQFYTGEYIDVDHTDDQGTRTRFAKRSGFCCEASRYVDCAGRKEWEGMVLMKRGDVWGSKTVYKAWKQ